MAIEPPAAELAVPVVITIDPAPVLDVPVLSSTMPLEAAVDDAVASVISPLLDKSDTPVVMLTVPPDLPVAVVLPAEIDTAPPSALSVSPTAMVTAPALPPADGPVPMRIAPESPAEASPELIVISPVLVPTPDNNATVPDVVELTPDARRMLPLVVDALPASTTTAPELAVTDAPVTRYIAPVLPAPVA
jgi:hypothetical protein